MGTATTEFIGRESAIKGLLIFDVSHIGDDRGFFQEKYQKEKLVKAGMPEDFMPVQQNLSYNKEAGVIRGFHAEPWNKYVSVVTGKAFCAWVDLRKGSPTFGEVVTLEVDKNKAVYIPKGIGNAFQTVEPETYYIYSVDDHWRPDQYNKYCFVNLSDPDIAVEWPIPLDKATMSERDKNHPLLKDINPLEI